MSETPIESLVRSRAKELGITLLQLVRRTGMSNVSKGLRRLDGLFSADFISTRGLIKALPLALDIPSEAVTAVIEQTRKQLSDEAEREWRASFKPNAIVLTGERGRPRQIFVAALLNASQHVHLEFPEAMPETEYLDHALAFMRSIGVRSQSSSMSPRVLRLTGVQTTARYIPLRESILRTMSELK